MLLLSGYTLGFFFPKQAAHLSADLPGDIAAKTQAARTDELARSPLRDTPERAEVPASLFFYRYF
jgi:hypothetical protein